MSLLLQIAGTVKDSPAVIDKLHSTARRLQVKINGSFYRQDEQKMTAVAAPVSTGGHGERGGSR